MANLLRILAALVLIVVVLFGSAGRWDLPFFWASIGLAVLLGLVARFTIDPGLLQERVHPAAGGKDRYLRLFLLPFVLAHLIVAGLDVGRFHWSSVPVGVQVAAIAGLATSLGWVLWSMRVNRFFSPAIRIQEERGHHLITSGPYRYVRHPGYAGMIAAVLCSGPALGSWWAMLPILGYIFLIVRRAAQEDRFLRQELKGYADYASRVRYRLLPGIW